MKENQLNNRTLMISRVIHTSPVNVYRAWTEPDLLKQWFAPKPWTTPEAHLDVRAGGGNLIVMRSPEGVDFPNRGQYLEVIPNQKLVFTDAYTGDWQPSERPYMTVVLSFEPDGINTKYSAAVQHWSETDREDHEKRGFYEGWGICADQLIALVENLPETKRMDGLLLQLAAPARRAIVRSGVTTLEDLA